MSVTRVAINGFGRIGRSAFKIAFERSDIEVVAINDLTDTKTLAYLLKYDSNYGTYQYDVSSDDTGIIVDGKHIAVLSERDPRSLPWRGMSIDVVIESTGFFTKSEDVDTIVLGANDEKITASTPVVSNASCTTNSLGAAMAILDANFGIEKSMLTTVHSYTASQKVQDAPAKDPREGRNAAENIVPTSTGAAIAVTKVLPGLRGKFDGISMRVPTPVVSISDVTVLLSRNVTVEEINSVFIKASKEPFYQGVLTVSDDPLVSRDYIGSSYSGIVDLSLTRVVDGNLAKVCIWYDNEWGYSNRLIELVADIGRAINY